MFSVVVLIYIHISNLQGAGGGVIAHQCSLRELYGSTGPLRKWKVSPAVWKTGFTRPQEMPAAIKTAEFLNMTSSSYLPSFSLNSNTDKFQLVGFGIIKKKNAIYLRIGLMTHLSLCPQG